MKFLLILANPLTWWLLMFDLENISSSLKFPKFLWCLTIMGEDHCAHTFFTFHFPWKKGLGWYGHNQPKPPILASSRSPPLLVFRDQSTFPLTILVKSCLQLWIDLYIYETLNAKIHFKMDLKISLEQNSANLTLKENMTL